MEFIIAALDVLLHLERYLDTWAANYGAWMYVILFLIIFAETGLVITPFLPGDSLLFAVGAIAARGVLSLPLVILLLSLAAIAGDTVNYSAGRYFGEHILKRFSRLVKPEHLKRTHDFYEKYGAKMIVLARFVPIVRTFAPFVAGIASMSYRVFAVFNVTGGVFWISSMTFAGFAFGNLEFVRRHFSAVVLAIVLISITPMIIEYLRVRRQRSASA